MLLEFTTANYKSFLEEAKFSMTKAAKQKGLDYSLLVEKAGKKEMIGLCSSVVYGPNAAGKTNLIGAMEVFRSIVLRGNIRDWFGKDSPNSALHMLSFIPNNKLITPKPVNFSVDFFENNMLIQYSLSLDLGLFLQSDYPRKVLRETLSLNGDLLFERGETLELKNLAAIQDYLPEWHSLNTDSVNQIAQNSLDPEELFLNNGFKIIFSRDFAELVTNWFEHKFVVVYRADSIEVTAKLEDHKKKMLYLEDVLGGVAKLFGVQSNALAYVSRDEEEPVQLCSIVKNIAKKRMDALSAEQFESYGTIRFINLFPLVLHALQTGSTLVVDEFDASIHPMALMSIINIFHNDDVNIHHAQLIFNTHNPIFLNSNLFRRDEIKFVERDDASNCSTVYALSDFGTTGEKGVRQHEDYMKNYFISRYGAIKDIDFTPLFEDLLTSDSEVQ